jgi:hypothetical protein
MNYSLGQKPGRPAPLVSGVARHSAILCDIVAWRPRLPASHRRSPHAETAIDLLGLDLFGEGFELRGCSRNN